MKPIITLLLVLCTITASAQKIHFCDTGNLWTVYNVNNDGCESYQYIHYTGDSVINGHLYSHMASFVSYILYTCEGWFQYQGPYGYFREDTANGRIYYLSSNDSTLETLAYDYSLHVGDTESFPLIEGYTNCTDSVISIDSVLINGVYHKQLNFVNIASQWQRGYSVVEGIGKIDGMFGEYGCFEGGANLICFSQHQVHPEFSLDYLMFCNGIFHYDNDTSCPLSTPQPIKSKTEITIFPNPTQDELNISLPAGFTSNTFALLYDMSGHCVQRIQLPSGNTTTKLNLRKCVEGTYLLLLQNGAGTLKKEKIIVQR